MTRYPIVLSLMVAAGCSGPPVGEVRDSGRAEETGADVSAVDASVDADVTPGDVQAGPDVPDAPPPDVATDAATDAGAGDVVASDSGPLPVDAATDAPVDVGTTDAGPTDAGPPDAGPPDAGPTDAGPPDAGPRDAGPPVMRFEFVSGTPSGTAGGVSMRSVMVWHGRHRGSAGGINYEGWFQ